MSNHNEQVKLRSFTFFSVCEMINSQSLYQRESVAMPLNQCDGRLAITSGVNDVSLHQVERYIRKSCCTICVSRNGTPTAMAYNPTLKMISLLATVIAHYKATTPPIPPPPPEEKVCTGQAKLFETILPWLRYAAMVSFMKTTQMRCIQD